VINPALTNPTVKTVVPELLCIKTVTTIPASTPNKGLHVNLSKISLSRSPADFCKPSPINLIPKRKIPNPPKKSNRRVCKSISNGKSVPSKYEIEKTSLYHYCRIIHLCKV